MNPAGIIITYMDWSKWKTWWFNIPLFLFQLTFMVVGTAIGKIKWDRRRNIIATVILWSIAISMWFISNAWLNAILLAIILFIGIPTLRNINWAVVRRAAQASHVRLCLRSWSLDSHTEYSAEIETEWYGEYINFGYPKAETEVWRMSQCDGKRFEYREPTFEPSPELIEAMIQYANDQEGKRYDHLQLFSFGLNFIFWLWPSWWGKEKLKWLNLRGGREVCSSGLVACLRWAYLIRYGWSAESAEKMLSEGYAEYGTIFFEGYDTAVIPPCLIVISKNWRR